MRNLPYNLKVFLIFIGILIITIILYFFTQIDKQMLIMLSTIFLILTVNFGRFLTLQDGQFFPEEDFELPESVYCDFCQKQLTFSEIENREFYFIIRVNWSGENIKYFCCQTCGKEYEELYLA